MLPPSSLYVSGAEVGVGAAVGVAVAVGVGVGVGVGVAVAVGAGVEVVGVELGGLGPAARAVAAAVVTLLIGRELRLVTIRLPC